MGRYRRVNITLPEELVLQLPGGLNVSRACADALAALTPCAHRQLRCTACALEHDRYSVERDAAHELYKTIMWALDELVRKGQTAESAARVVRDVAERWGIAGAADHPIPRPTKRARAEAAAEREARAA